MLARTRRALAACSPRASPRYVPVFRCQDNRKQEQSEKVGGWVGSAGVLEAGCYAAYGEEKQAFQGFAVGGVRRPECCEGA